MNNPSSSVLARHQVFDGNFALRAADARHLSQHASRLLEVVEGETADDHVEFCFGYSGELVQNLERWLANSQTPPGPAAEVRAMIERDGHEDPSGTRPYLEDGQWFFRQPTLAVVGRKLNR